MDNIKKIVTFLEKEGCKICSNKELNFDKDIDVSCKKNLKKIETFLEENNFIKIEQEYYNSIFFIRFYDTRLLRIDLFNCDCYYDTPYFRFKIRENIMLDDKEKIILKSLFKLRKKGEINKEEYDKKIGELINTCFIENPFRKIPSYDEYNRLLSKNFFTIFLVFKKEYFFQYFKARLRGAWAHIKNGKVIAMIGPDGSGKTTVSKILTRELAKHVQSIKYLYLGGTKSLENMKLPFIMKVFLNALRLFFLSWYAFILRMLGFIVLLDRHPKFDTLLQKGNLKLRSLIYISLLPPLDFVVALIADPKTIYSRKKELEVSEIERQIRKIKKLKEKEKNIYLIKNENVEDTLNKLLKILFTKK